MVDTDTTAKLPANLASALAGLPNALVPASIKALDRLIGAGVDIPVAWLAQQKAKIDAQTQSYSLVESAIAKAAASEAGADQETVQRAVDVLVRKAYKKQSNREAVAAAMIEDIKLSNEPPPITPPHPPELKEVDEDWLNVFERYAEDASTERMQQLWGRVLAGEVRQPGKFSMRTLRFLSEFSQVDGLLFSNFCMNSFSDFAPNKLVKPDGKSDIRDLISLEASGLIQGASGFGLIKNFTFNTQGNVFIGERDIIVMLVGQPGFKIELGSIVLTPLGQELVTLLPSRNAREAAVKVAHAIRIPQMKSAFLGTSSPQGKFVPMEILWQEESPPVSTPGNQQTA